MISMPDELPAVFAVPSREPPGGHDAWQAKYALVAAQAAKVRAVHTDNAALGDAHDSKIDKLSRALPGQRFHRTARACSTDWKVQFKEHVTLARVNELGAQAASVRTSLVGSFTRKRPLRTPLAEAIERERIVVGPPTTWASCGGLRLTKPGKEWWARQRTTLSRSSEVIKPFDGMRKCCECFALFLEHGKFCRMNNAEERALRSVALARRNRISAGFHRAAVMRTVGTTCRRNGFVPKAWLADVPVRIVDHAATRLHEPLPWKWKRASPVTLLLAA